MINRALIRLKVVQLIYAYYQNEGKTTEVALGELNFSLEQAYKLYQSHLLLLVELHRLAEHRLMLRKQRGNANSTNSNDYILSRNRFLLQLSSNKTLLEFTQKEKMDWSHEDIFVKKIYDAFCADEVFLRYIDKGDNDYAADRELIRKLYKNHIEKNEDFDPLLEEQNLYWNDDKEIVDSFVLKTIKRFEEANGAEQELLPRYATSEDQEFAQRLFLQTIEHAQQYRELIAKNTKNWEFSRLAFMDVVIMQIALAEIIGFESIPLSVSFNEYLDIAKVYSTPRSSSYIHGMLDNIVKKIKAQGLIMK